MHIIDFFIRNPVKVSVGVLLVALFGGISLATMSKQLTPEVQNPVLTIETRWPGASPQEVEREIVQEQEEQLKSVEGVTKMSSESMDSRGRITLEFAVGTNLEEGLLKVNTRLQQVREYPADADEPTISTSDSSDRPIARFILSPQPPQREHVVEMQQRHPELAEPLASVLKAHNPGLAVLRMRDLYKARSAEFPDLAELLPPDLEVTRLRRFAEDVIEARLERVPGVSDAEVSGGLEEELQVVVDPERLAARQLTIADVRDALRGQNADTSGGDFTEGKRRWVVRVLGQYRNEEQVANQILATRDGAPIYVRDVAEVRIGYKKPDSIVRRYGISGISVTAQRETGANVLDVMKGLRQATDELNEGILARRQLELFQNYDETDYIYSAIGLVQQNIFIGGALTMIVLMLFLHASVRTLMVVPLIAATAVAAAYLSPWWFALSLVLIVGSGFWFARGSLVVGLAIPTSIIGTFLILKLLGRSLNVISLAGLAFAVGMLVDNAVVVLENIYRRFHAGESAAMAASRGAQEVAGAVVASTLTTIAVFLPVLFVEDVAGQLFRDIALAISAAVGLSLIVSFTLIPTAAARLLATPRRRKTTADARDAAAQQIDVGTRVPWPLAWIGNLGVSTIVGVNRWVQAGPVRAMGVTVVLVALSLGLSYLYWPKVEYLPSGNRNLVFAYLSVPPGYSTEHLMELGKMAEAELRPYWDVDLDSPEARKLEYPVIGDFFFVARGRQVFLGVRSHDTQRAGEFIPLVREIGAKIPGTITVAKQSSLFERGITGGRTIDVEITGPELSRLVALGQQIMLDLKEIMPTAQALPRPSLDLSSPEVHIEPLPMQAVDLGINARDLGYTVDALVDGAYAGDYYFGGDKIDLTILGVDSETRQTQDLAALPLAAPGGQLVPLAAVADVTLGSGPEQINRRERLRTITIQVNPPPEIPLEDAMEQISAGIIRPLVGRGELDDGYAVNLSGTADKLRDAWFALRWNLLLALVITYLLMAALFESWLYPFVILFSVPLGAVGGILGLRLLNVFVLQPLDVLTMLGFIILIGTVVNNAILIVHQSLNHLRFDGMSPREAILEGTRTRVRPIFMTTMTTLLGLLPLVLFPGAGSELYRGLGSVVLGGLLVSTVFTLFLVPTVFRLTMDAKETVVRLLGLEIPREEVGVTPAHDDRVATSEEYEDELPRHREIGVS